MKKSGKTPEEPRKLNRMNGKETGVPFGEQGQPSPDAKKQGWAKKKAGQQLLRAMMALPFKGLDGSPLKTMVANYYGIPEVEVTVEMMLHGRQLEKAIQKGDTPAYQALMARGFGAPKQSFEGKVKTENESTTTHQVDWDSLPLEVLEKVYSAIKPTEGEGDVSED